jgi:hypothetical protein
MVHALIPTAVYSRHMFVWLSFSQTLESVIASCEAAWSFYGGIFNEEDGECSKARRETTQESYGQANPTR